MVFLTIDGAYKPCLSLLGQAPHGSSAATHAAQAIEQKDSMHVVVTVRGLSGSLVGIGARSAEGSADVKRVIFKELTVAQLEMVQHICVDNPSAELWGAFKAVCRNLFGLSLDLLHPIYAWESANGETKTPGSDFFREIMSKWAASRGTKWEGSMYEGGPAPAPTKREADYMKKLQHRTMLKKVAKKIQSDLDPKVRFSSRAEFVRALAALAKLYPKEIKRKEAGKKTTVHDMLLRLAEPERTEWLCNYSRQRERLSRKQLEVLALGTASNEALHHELNRWFRTIVGQHQPSLELKLSIFKLLKLLTHVSALTHKTTKNMSQALVAARVVSATNPWGPEEKWTQFCATTPTAEVRTKRTVVRKKLKAWLKKTGDGGRVKKKGMKKRTVFSRVFNGVKLFYSKPMKSM